MKKAAPIAGNMIYNRIYHKHVLLGAGERYITAHGRSSCSSGGAAASGVVVVSSTVVLPVNTEHRGPDCFNGFASTAGSTMLRRCAVSVIIRSVKPVLVFRSLNAK